MKYTVLVNKENKLKDSFLNKIELVVAKDIDNQDVKVEKETYDSFLLLKNDLEKQGINIGIDSAYRSVEYQEELMNRLFLEKGEEYVNNYVALPGYSEHHTGLAIDVGILLDENLGDYSSKLEKAYQILHKALVKYGFILRYPLGKEEITGYSYEAWHIRYVGKIPAQIIKRDNLTLEEYLTNYSSILCINKPKNMTSFDVVNKISHIYGIKKVGHTGTLDPMATGVMIVAIGKATKIVELLTAEDKEYIAEAELGYQTDTYDTEGVIIQRKEIPKEFNLEEVVLSYQKTYLQEAPIYSAIKVNGKKLYDYAREKKEVDLPKRKVTIKEIELLNSTNHYFRIRALVSKGCYIRSLVNDIGLSLGTFATMSSLERTKQGSITIDQTNTLEEVKEGICREYKIEEVLDYPIIEVDETLYQKIKKGVKVFNQWNIKDKVLFKTKENQLIGIYEAKDDSLITWKNFI